MNLTAKSVMAQIACCSAIMLITAYLTDNFACAMVALIVAHHFLPFTKDTK